MWWPWLPPESRTPRARWVGSVWGRAPIGSPLSAVGHLNDITWPKQPRKATVKVWIFFCLIVDIYIVVFQQFIVCSFSAKKRFSLQVSDIESKIAALNAAGKKKVSSKISVWLKPWQPLLKSKPVSVFYRVRSSGFSWKQPAGLSQKKKSWVRTFPLSVLIPASVILMDT